MLPVHLEELVEWWSCDYEKYWNYELVNSYKRQLFSYRYLCINFLENKVNNIKWILNNNLPLNDMCFVRACKTFDIKLVKQMIYKFKNTKIINDCYSIVLSDAFINRSDGKIAKRGYKLLRYLEKYKVKE